MRLIHFSRTGSLELDRNRPYTTIREDKPDGLWVSNEDSYGWSRWCEDEGFDAPLDDAFEVTLKDTPNVLIVRDLADFNYFHNAYARPGILAGTLGPLSINSGMDYNVPDWHLVQQHYKGIIFERYFYEHRLNKFWYYGWDCASGVIWDLSAIESFTRYEEVKQ